MLQFRTALYTRRSRNELLGMPGYNALRTASHRDLSWHLFSSTSTSLTCQAPSPESMRMLII